MRIAEQAMSPARQLAVVGPGNDHRLGQDLKRRHLEVRAVDTVEVHRKAACVDCTQSDFDDAANLHGLSVEQAMHGDLSRAQ